MIGFRLAKELEEDYFTRVEIGKEISKNIDVGILSLTRNSSNTLEKNIERVCSLGFSKSFYIYENDSTDGTQDILEKLKKNPEIDFNYRSEILNRRQYGATRHPDRTVRLAEYRNDCLEYARENFSQKDYILVIDLDFSFYSLAGVYHTLSFLEDTHIDAMAGFSFEPKKIQDKIVLWNYDSWAFRLNAWTNWYDYCDIAAWFGFWTPMQGSKPIRVNSAFGGSCIYKTQKFLNGIYAGEDCEHVNFHKSLNENNEKFLLYANPSQAMCFNGISVGEDPI